MYLYLNSFQRGETGHTSHVHRGNLCA